ncbi:MAG TPA: universal stress protein, partial [Gaiellaceae bacterium]|nr:universal stress protein [Gaiellaceae bacterium]
GIQPFVKATFGKPAAVIAETARALDADLVVLGRANDRWRHRSLRQRSVRRSLLRHLDCDVLVVTRGAH